MKNEQGLTLIELLIVLVIMVSISTLAFRLFSYGSSVERSVANDNELQREARFIMETLSKEVRDGATVSSKVTYNTSTKTLTLNSSGSILSKNVTTFDVTETALAKGQKYVVKLVLTKGKYKYEVSTELTNDASSRIRY